MKKITKIAATFAAAMAIFLGASCSHDGGASLATLGAGGGGGGGGKTRATTGSWNFVSQADTVAWVATLKTNTITKAEDGTLSLDKSGDISIKSDPLSDSTDGLTLTILEKKPWSGATDPNYSYKEAASGLRIKNPALKIADVKGKVKVTIEWACISGKAANEREIQLYKGDDEGGTIVDKAGNDATSGGSGNVDMTPFEKTVEAGDGMDLYIGGSNNIFIKTVKIEEADPSSPDEEIDDGDGDEDEDDEDEDEYLGTVVTLSALDWESALGTLETKTNWPSKSGFAIVAKTGGTVVIEEENSDPSKQKKVQLETEAKVIKNRIKMGGKAAADSRYIEMPLEGACKISIWALGGGDGNTGRCVQIATADAPATSIKKSEAVAGSSNTIEAVTIKMSDEDIAKADDGLFALGGDAGINIYYITIQYKE